MALMIVVVLALEDAIDEVQVRLHSSTGERYVALLEAARVSDVVEGPLQRRALHSVGKENSTGIAQVDVPTAKDLLERYFGASAADVTRGDQGEGSDEAVWQRLTSDDRFSIAIAAAKLADVREQIRPELRSNKSLFVAYAADRTRIKAYNDVAFEFDPSVYPIAYVRSTTFFNAARGNVLNYQEFQGAFGGLHDETPYYAGSASRHV